MSSSNEERSCAPPFGGGTDSGYASRNDSSRSTSVQSTFSGEYQFETGNRFRRKHIKLKFFPKDVSDRERKRFYDLRLMFEEPIITMIRKRNLQYTRLSMTLRTLGESETTTKPCILVACDLPISNHVRDFLKESWVKEELKPTDTVCPIPHFDAYVVGVPPTQPAAICKTEVFYHDGYNSSDMKTLSGVLVTTTTDFKLSSATLGGVFEVSIAGEGRARYGMTAGHLVSPCGVQSHSNLSPNSTHFTSGGIRTCSGSIQPDKNVVLISDDDESEVELEFRYFDDMDFDYQSHVAADLRETSTTDAIKAGEAFLLAELEPETPNLDYAIVELDSSAKSLPNLYPEPAAKSWHGSNQLVCGPKRVMSRGLGRKVSVLCGTQGKQSGFLEKSPSSLLISPSLRFTETISLFLEDGKSEQSLHRKVSASIRKES